MSQRTEYTPEDEDLLAQYIAKYNPLPKGRQGNLLYQKLCENAERKWPWADRHPWQSWREHYIRNCERLDKRIAFYVKQASPNFSIPPPSSPPSPRRDPALRVPFTEEDDDRIVEYLATRGHEDDGLLGQRVWKDLVAEEHRFPWVARHTWQSWRERYKKHVDYFNWAIRRYLAGDDFNEPAVPRPRTVDRHRVKKPQKKSQTMLRRAQTHSSKPVARARPPSQAPQAGSPRPAKLPEKRKRKSVQEGSVDERPVKKKRFDRVSDEDDRRGTVNQDDDQPNESSPEPAQTLVAAEEPPAVVQVKDAPDNTDSADGLEEDGDDDEDGSDEESGNERMSPPGSEDYSGEIFASQIPVAEDVDGDKPTDESGTDSDVSVKELDELLGDEYQPEQQELNMDVDVQDPLFVVSQGGALVDRGRESQVADRDDVSAPPPESQAQGQGPARSSPLSVVDDGSVHQAATCPEPHDPPARRHVSRIRDIEAPIATPELSPTQEAVERHHEPGPVPRRHAKRIKKSREEDFFGTPSADLPTDNEEPSSPTAEVEARHAHTHAHKHDRSQDLEREKPKVRQLPRLVQGAFNKAFSDARGHSRISPQGRPRRHSGVDLDNEGEEEEEEDDTVQPADIALNEEHASELPQWPPPRRKSSVKSKVPAAAPPVSTPSPARSSKGKERERTVTTEEILSIRTVRTVERRVGRPPKTTSYPNAAVSIMEDEAAVLPPPSQQQDVGLPSLAIDDAQMDGDEDTAPDDSWLSPSQHHPFSQAPHPFSQRSPTRPAVAKPGVPVSKTDLSRFQRLLHPGSANEDVAAQVSNATASSSSSAQERQRGNGPLPGPSRAKLESILRMEGKRAFPEPSKATRHSTGSAAASRLPSPEDQEMDEDAEETFVDSKTSMDHHSRVSPLADKGEMGPGSAERQGELIPRLGPSSHDKPRVDKGKARANMRSTDGQARRHTVDGPATPDVFSAPAPQAIAPRPQHPSRQSLPAMIARGGGRLQANRSASGLALPFSCPRSPSLPSSIGLSRSVSPPRSGNVSTASAKMLPANELEMIQELGMQTALRTMARNHGFSEETVQEAFALTGSLQLTDNLLRAMREGANEKASETLLSLLPDADEGEDEIEDAEAQDEPVEEGRTREEAEVERELTQSPGRSGVDWLLDGEFDPDDAPLAESSRIDASYRSGSGSRRRRETLRIQPLPPEGTSSVDVEYSPPRKTRAAAYVKRERRSLGRSPRESGSGAADGGVEEQLSAAESSLKAGSLAYARLARMGPDDWRRLEEKHGKGSAKVLAGKALAKLLQR
ncbi:hypothetical protein BD413DRAFT_242669 [Trametes elegans]|nr:hypothetical protein BD413DRAFT_242669 [Trametes elegans]